VTNRDRPATREGAKCITCSPTAYERATGSRRTNAASVNEHRRLEDPSAAEAEANIVVQGQISGSCARSRACSAEGASVPIRDQRALAVDDEPEDARLSHSQLLKGADEVSTFPCSVDNHHDVSVLVGGET
jgi:hypothetical protein